MLKLSVYTFYIDMVRAGEGAGFALNFLLYNHIVTHAEHHEQIGARHEQKYKPIVLVKAKRELLLGRRGTCGTSCRGKLARVVPHAGLHSSHTFAHLHLLFSLMCVTLM